MWQYGSVKAKCELSLNNVMRWEDDLLGMDLSGKAHNSILRVFSVYSCPSGSTKQQPMFSHLIEFNWLFCTKVRKQDRRSHMNTLV